MPGDVPEGGGGEGRAPPASAWAAILLGLKALAAEAGVDVRIEPFALAMAGKGGLCRIKGRRVILVDAKLGVVEQIGVLGEALGRLVPTGRSVPPELVPYLHTGHGRVGRLLRPRPLARGR